MGQWVTDNKKIGLALTTFGSIFLVLGVLLFFDRPLLTLGNLLFVTGTVFLIGPNKCFQYFTDRTKIRGSICFIIGVILVLIKWPVVGMLFEMFGVANLFGNFFPIILSFLRKIPFLEPVLNAPVIKKILDTLVGENNSLIGE